MITTLTIGAQAAGLAVIARLAEQHPDMPAAYIVSSFVTPGEVTIQLDSIADVEAWREALHVAATEVTCKTHGSAGQSRLEFRAAVEGIACDVYAPFTVAAPEAEGAAA
jgi:hypothetical protein